MVDERKLIAKLEDMVKESKEESGLKEPALLQKVMDEVKSMAVNEEIKARIEREDVSDKWIPVSERLPVPFETVMITAQEEGDREPLVYEGAIGAGDMWEVDGVGYRMKSEAVKAWMPLPEPYREEIAE